MRFNLVLSLTLVSALSAPLAFAQQPGGGPPGPPSSRHMDRDGGRGMSDGMRGGFGSGFRLGPPGMWWKNPDLAQKIALTPDQQKRMDDIFQKSRLELIDLKASLEKQEVTLQPMLSENPPDTNKILAQIDHVAQARADLEKGNARMLLGIRGVLSPDQWTKLQTEGRDNRRTMMRRFRDRNGRPDGQGPGTAPTAPAPPPGL
jgi:Spy/CpxP family protein refolding chaperone